MRLCLYVEGLFKEKVKEYSPPPLVDPPVPTCRQNSIFTNEEANMQYLNDRTLRQGDISAYSMQCILLFL